MIYNQIVTWTAFAILAMFTTLRALLKSGLFATQLYIRSDTSSFVQLHATRFMLGMHLFQLSMVLSFIVVKRGVCILYFNGTLIKCEALLCFMTKEKNNETVRERQKNSNVQHFQCLF